jgi:cation diffusion facilitator family transporter
VFAAFEASNRLIHPRPLTNIGWLFAAGLIGLAGNELVALYRIRVGRHIGSAALTADGYHARTDGFTSLAVVVGAIGAWLGFDAADPIAGVVISLAILAVLRTAAIDVLRRLMNSVDPSLVDRIEHEAARVEGVQTVYDVRVRWEGHRLCADLSITVDPTLSINRSHELAHDVEHALVHHVAHLDNVAVHEEPAGESAPLTHERVKHHG